jgi:hypothetical protein
MASHIGIVTPYIASLDVNLVAVAQAVGHAAFTAARWPPPNARNAVEQKIIYVPRTAQADLL